MIDNASSLIQRELSAGEKLLWEGRPATGIRFRKQDAFLIPFSLLWGGFAIVWETAVIRSNAPLLFRLWGVPFVLAGLYLIFGRFVVDSKQRANTLYALTNSRLLIISGLISQNIRSLNLRTLSEVHLGENRDGIGTIAFGPNYPMARFAAGGWPGTGKYAPPSFEMISQASTVYELIRQTQSESLK